MQVCGWVLQAIALDRGSLVILQTIISLSLVFALPLGAWLTNQRVGRGSIIGACITMAGIIVFIAIGQPQGGVAQPTTTAWWTAGIIISALMVLLAWLAHNRRGPTSAALFATAAGLGFAFQAAVTKVFMTQIGNGLAAILSTWTTYALIITALASFGLQQSALMTGYLALAKATCNATTRIMSIIFGVIVFQESISRSQAVLSPAALGLTMAVIGVLLLA